MTIMASRAPGLYLRGVESDPVAATETAVTAFVGVAERGPLDSPQAVRNWGEYVEVFGGTWGFGVMAESVYAFFQNGGARACAVRVAHELAPAAPSPCPAQEDLGTASNVLQIQDAGGDETLRLQAKSPGKWGDRLTARATTDASREQDLGALAAPGVAGAFEIIVDFVQDFRLEGALRITDRDNAFATSAHVIKAIDEPTRRLTLDIALPRAYPAGSRVLGRGFALEVADEDRRETFDNLSMNPAHPRYFLEIINGSPRLTELDAARAGHSSLVRAAQVFGATGASRFKPASSLVDGPVGFSGGGDGLTLARVQLLDAGDNPSLVITARLRGRAGNRVRVKSEPFTGRIALAVPGGGSANSLVIEDVRGWVAGDTLRITHPTSAVTEARVITAVDADSHTITFAGLPLGAYPLFSPVSVDSPASVDGRFNLHISSVGGPEAPESFFNLSMTAGLRFCSDIVNGVAGSPGVSRLICAHPAPLAAAPPLTKPPQLPDGDPLSGGEDPGEMPARRYTGYEDDDSLFLPGGPAGGPVGLATLEAVVEVNLVALPDLAALPWSLETLLVAQHQILTHCRRTGDRFALLDPPLGTDLAAAADWPARLQDGNLPRFGAAYYPWLSVVVEDQDRLLPPSGVVAGLIAQSDAASGVGRAPANLTCKGVVGLEREIDSADQGGLNERGVNCIRKFEDGAVRLYGARTLSGEEDQLYVNNRRLVLGVVKALSRNLLWAVFEPNDESLRKRVRDSLEGYFQGLLSRGLTAGSKPEDAYYVKVGGDLESGATTDAGELLAEVGLALSRPAEFIVISVKRRPEIMALVEEET